MFKSHIYQDIYLFDRLLCGGHAQNNLKGTGTINEGHISCMTSEQNEVPGCTGFLDCKCYLESKLNSYSL